ncbi:MAG: DUF3102 domain-containing protein [Burkholderiales bacterium]
MSKAVKTRAQWAAEIRAAHKQSIEGILKMGRTLIAAKKALEHGAFQKMIDHDLPFDASTAQRLMKIGRDPRIANAARVQLLPMAWGTLYELTKLPGAEFKQAVASGAINPAMTREQARTVRVNVSHRDVVIAAPYTVRPIYRNAGPTVTEQDDEPPMRLVASATQAEPITDVPLPPPDVTSLALAQIERLVGVLAMAVERGDVRVDIVFEGRARAVADRLLSMIADDERRAIN